MVYMTVENNKNEIKNKDNDIIVNNNDCYTFEAKFEDGSTFHKIVESIKDVSNECNFDFTKKGIIVQAMDASHLCLVLLCIHKDDIDEYQCNTHCQIGIQITSLIKLLKCMNKQENGSLHLRYHEQESEKELELFCHDKKDEKESKFRLKLLQIDAEKLDIPEQEYDADMEMNASTFQNLCKDLGTIGDTLEINITKKDSDEGKTHIEFKTNGEIGSGIRYRKDGKCQM